ncbi:glycosyltransferase family 39 protein [Candidatus Sumerlaeota bacterium]|nr:glycosyltransferase family 39 protein [Candidatus Sumerlaeota bacterium]
MFSPLRKMSLLVFAVCLGATLLLEGRERFESTDAAEVYRDAFRIATGDFPLSKYAPGQVVLTLPAALVEAHLLGNVEPQTREFLSQRTHGLLSPILISAIGPAVTLSLARLGFGVVSAGWLGLLAVFGTYLFPYATQSYSESSQAFMVAWAFFFFLAFSDKGRWIWAAAAGTFLGGAVLCKPNLVLLGPVMLAAIPFVHGWRNVRRWIASALAFGLPLGFLTGAYLAYNYWRFDSAFSFGYGGGMDRHVGFHGSFLTGFFGQLASPGKSFFLYSPVLFLAFWGWGELRRFRPPVAWAGLVGSLALVAFYSKWWCWAGDWGWGPRFLVPLAPLAFVPAALGLRSLWRSGSRLRRAFLVALCAVSVGLQLAVPLVYFGDYTGMDESQSVLRNARDGRFLDHLLFEHFYPDSSPLLGVPWHVVRCAEVAPMQRNGTFGHFAARWRGEISSPAGTESRLRLRAGGEARFRVGGIDAQTDPDSCATTKTLALTLPSMPQEWLPVEIEYEWRGEGPAHCSLEYEDASDGGFRPVETERLRNEGGEAGLLGEYYVFSGRKKRWLVRTDPRIALDWTGATPFTEWISRGFPPRRLYVRGEYPYFTFRPARFFFNPWPASVYYRPDAPWRRLAVFLFASISFAWIGSWVWLIRLTAKDYYR